MLKKNSIILAADLETTKATKEKNAQVYAWAFCVLTKYTYWVKRHRYLFNNGLIKHLIKKNKINKLIKEDLTFYYGYCLTDLIKILKTVSTSITLLFQNGNHFDVHFIVDELNKQGFVRILPFLDYSLKNQVNFSNFQLYIRWYLNELEKRKDVEHLFKIFNDNTLSYKVKNRLLNRLSIKEYRSLEVNHDFFQVKICVNKDKKHKNKKIYINILDPYLQFRASLAIKGKEINLPKLEIEYDKLELYQNIQEFEKDGNQLNYLLRDVEILFKHTLKMYQFIGFSQVRITAPQIAYQQFIIFFVKNHLDKLTKEKRIGCKQLLKRKHKQNVYQWKIFDLGLRKYFKSKYLTKKMYFKHILTQELVKDTLSSEEREYLFDHYYRGGICHVNEKYRGVITPAIGYDINSSYPNVMQSEKLCPIGPQLNIEVNIFDKQYYCFIRLQALVNIYLKDFMPFLRNTENRSEFEVAFTDDNFNWKKFWYKYSYVKQINRTDIFFITSSELWHLCKILKINNETDFKKVFLFKIEFVFKATTFSYFFKDFVHYWYTIKKTDPNKKSIAKLILNSTYGKFAQQEIKQATFDYEMENGEINTLTKLYNKLECFYLPLGIAIPAQARINLCKVIDYNYDNFIYADTDSAYFTKANKSLPLSTKIGDWKKEAEFSHFLVRRGKQYIGINVSKEIGKIAISGFKIPLEYKYYNLKLDNMEKNNYFFITQIMGFTKFLKGFTFKNQLTSQRFKGGMNILTVIKKLPPTWSHKLHISNEQEKLIKEHYNKDLINARKLDNYFKQSYQNNYLKIKPLLLSPGKLNSDYLKEH